MNYLQELLAFKDWCLINQPPSGQIALWHALMMAANASGWQEWVSVPSRTLELLSGLSHSGINNARKGLLDRGRIEYRPSDNRKKASKYKIISFYQKKEQKKNECENELRNELENECENESASNERPSERTLYKQKENKQKETNISSSDKKKEQPFVPYQQITNLYHEICISYSKIRTVSEERKNHIGARYKQYNNDIDIFRELFTMAESSSFLKGKNNKNWKADFDWLMNEANMAKVLEGKYKKTATKEESKDEYPDNW